MNYLKALFDIQRVHIDGASLHYELYYKVDNSYVKLVDTKFSTIQDAQKHMHELLDID